MKTWRRPLWLLTLTAVFTTLVGSLFLTSALAATGQMYLTPASNSVQNGNNLTVNLRINPGTGVDGVQATVNFDAAKLAYVSIDGSGSAFPTTLQQSTGAGTLTIARGKDLSGNDVSGDSQIVAITFKAQTGSGSSSVTLSSANATSAGNYTDPSTANATVNFTTPVTPPTSCPSGQTGTPPNCVSPPVVGGGSSSGSSSGGSSSVGSSGGSANSGTATGTGTAPAAGTPPIIAAQDLQFTQAVITATSKTPTTMYIKYSLDKSLSLSTPLSALATSHQLALDPNVLLPGETYYYQVVAKDQQGVITTSSVQSITLKGLSLKIGIFDKNHHPLRNKTVTLHTTSYTAKTDKQGFATYINVTPGEHHLSYTAGKQTYQAAVQVDNNVVASGNVQTAALQNVSVVYNLTQPAAWWSSRWLSGTVIALVVLAAAAFFIRRNIQSAGFGGGTPIQAGAVVVNGTPKQDNSPSVAPVSVAPANGPSLAAQLSEIPYPSDSTPGKTVAPQNTPPKGQIV